RRCRERSALVSIGLCTGKTVVLEGRQPETPATGNRRNRPILFRGLVPIVPAAAKGDVVHRRTSAPGERHDVVKLELVGRAATRWAPASPAAWSRRRADGSTRAASGGCTHEERPPGAGRHGRR